MRALALALALALPSAHAEPSDEELGRRLQGELHLHAKDIHDCYDRELSSGLPGARGEILLRLFVAPDASVARAEVLKDQIGSPSLASCLITKVRSWRLPTIAGPTEQQVVFPLAFRPSASSAVVVHAADLASYPILGGKGAVKLLFDPPPGASMQLLEAQAGAEVALHQHEQSDELLYLLSGKGEMTVAGEKYAVTTGDAIRIPKATAHSLRVIEKLSALQCYTPAGPEQRFKEKRK